MSAQENSTHTDRYTHGYSEEHRRFLSTRTAQDEGDLLLPHLRPGMRLLDCGCGQGALTTSLAGVVAPGEVVGIDIEESQVEAARAWAARDRVANARFEVGS